VTKEILMNKRIRSFVFASLTIVAVVLAQLAPTTYAQTPVAERFDGVTLDVLAVSQPPQLDCLQMAADEFSQQTGATVNINGQGYGQLRDAALAAFVGGTGAFDVISTAYQWTGEFAEPGYLLPLDDLIAANPPETIDDFIPRAMELYGQWNGQQVSLPFNGEAMLLFYRSDVFEENGLQPPTTFEEFDQIAQQLTGDDFYGTAIMGLREQAMTMWSNRYWALGGGSLDLDENGTITIDREPAIQALNQLQTEVNEYSPPGALTFGLPEASAEFVNGRVAMVEMWPSFLGPMTIDAEQVAPEVLGNVAVAQVPGGIPHSGGWGMSIAADSDAPEAAYAFIRLATSPSYDLDCFQQTGKGPVRQSTYDTLSEQADLEQYWLAPQGEAVQAANPRSRAPEAGELNDMFDEVVARFLAGELTAEQAVDEMQSRIDQTLAG
jgi:multiple sugar transport system substrate-binding protein